MVLGWIRRENKKLKFALRGHCISLICTSHYTLFTVKGVTDIFLPHVYTDKQLLLLLLLIFFLLHLISHISILRRILNIFFYLLWPISHRIIFFLLLCPSSHFFYYDNVWERREKNSITNFCLAKKNIWKSSLLPYCPKNMWYSLNFVFYFSIFRSHKEGLQNNRTLKSLGLLYWKNKNDSFFLCCIIERWIFTLL